MMNFNQAIPQLSLFSQQSKALELVLGLMSEAVLVVRADGHVAYANPAFLKLTGYTREAIDHGMATPWFEAAGQMLEMWTSLTQGHGWCGHVKLRCADGSTLETEASAAPLLDEAGAPQGCVQVLRDLTQQARLEAQLMHSQKMEAIGRLAGGVAHDFNNLLTVINGHTDMLLLRHRDSDMLRRELLEIRRAGESASSLTRQLLAFSRRQQLQLKVFSPNKSLLDLEKMLRRLIGEQIELKLGLTEEAIRIHADQGQFEQVVMNLAVNARDAMPQGGRLLLATRALRFDQPQPLGQSILPAGAYCELTVEDSGCGIDPALLPNIFEPFFTTKEPGKGTGLGLSTVYGIVNQCGGAIYVESARGRGSAFHIYLPLVMPGDTAPRERDGAPLLHRGETILIVEDDMMVRGVLSTVLQQHGYKVLEAADGPGALEISGALDGRIDLMISDVIMPHMTGFELARQMRQARPETRIIFMSGYTDDMVNESGLELDAAHFLQKPFSTEAVARAVRHLLDEPAG